MAFNQPEVRHHQRRLERSGSGRKVRRLKTKFPDCAALHPGYACYAGLLKNPSRCAILGQFSGDFADRIDELMKIRESYKVVLYDLPPFEANGLKENRTGFRHIAPDSMNQSVTLGSRYVDAVEQWCCLECGGKCRDGCLRQFEVNGSGGEVNDPSVGLVASVCQPSTLRMVICPEASSAQNNIAAVSGDGRTVWVLMRRLNSSGSRSTALLVRAERHWPGGRRVKVNSRSPASSRLSATARHFSRHLRMKVLAALLDLLRRGGVDHVGVRGIAFEKMSLRGRR